MEKEAEELLKVVISLESISFYELVNMRARKKRVKAHEIFDHAVKIIYMLASNNLVELETVEGKDGLETIVKTTPMGETYVASSKIRK